MQRFDHIKGGNTSNMLKHLTAQHAITLLECKVFDTLLSDGGDSRGGTASSVSKVPGNVKLSGPVDCNGALKSHALSVTVPLLGLCHALPPHIVWGGGGCHSFLHSKLQSPVVMMLATYCMNNFHLILTFSWRELQKWGRVRYIELYIVLYSYYITGWESIRNRIDKRYQ